MSDTSLTEHDIRLKRLRFRAWHRGIREMDLILGRYADAHLNGLSAAELDAFERLLEVPDITLYNWITGMEAVPPAEASSVFHAVRDHGRRLKDPAGDDEGAERG